MREHLARWTSLPRLDLGQRLLALYCFPASFFVTMYALTLFWLSSHLWIILVFAGCCIMVSIVHYLRSHQYLVQSIDWDYWLATPRSIEEMQRLAPAAFQDLVIFLFEAQGYVIKRSEEREDELFLLRFNFVQGRIICKSTFSPINVKNSVQWQCESSQRFATLWIVMPQVATLPLRMAAAESMVLQIIDGPILERWCTELPKRQRLQRLSHAAIRAEAYQRIAA